MYRLKRNKESQERVKNLWQEDGRNRIIKICRAIGFVQETINVVIIKKRKKGKSVCFLKV